MRIVHYLKCLFFALRYTFSVRRPIINQLETVDVVFHDKGYFLISWNFSNAYVISLSPINLSYFNKRKSVIVKLDNDIVEIKVVVRNTWKKFEKTIKLTRIELNAQTDFDIITHFESLQTNSLRSKKLRSTYSIPEIRFRYVAFKNPEVQVRLNNVSVKSGALSYNQS